MSVIVYECDTCNRIIEIPQNPRGLETIQRCIITDGCRGKLFQKSVNQDHIRGNFPDKVEGLTDWTQRRILFDFVQSVTLIEWTINHNLGVIPSIQVFVERPKQVNLDELDIEAIDFESLVELIEIEPESIEIVNLNTLIVKFLRPEKGIAQAIARASRPVITEPITQVGVTAETTFQLSNDQELTIATLNSNPFISLELEFIGPDGFPISVSPYSVDDNPSIISPWNDFNRVFVNGKTYTVRSFDFIAGVPEFADDTITDGSFFFFKELDSMALNKGDLIVLLANPPHKNQDKITNRFIDPHNIGQDEALNSFFFDDRELFSSANLIRTVFPFIKSV